MTAAASKATVRLKGPKDLTNTIIAKINATKPKGEAAKNCTFEVTRSTTEILSKVRYVLSTGMDPYDEAIGIGGLPFGRVIEVYGLDGSCKSAIALRSAIRMQERHIYEIQRDEANAVTLKRVPDNVPVFTIYIDNEQSIDADGKTTIDGVELDVAVARCDTIDQMFKIIDTAIDGVDAYSREHEVECFILVVVDTIAGTSSREEIESKWEAVDYPRQPRQLREGFRVMMRKLSRRNVLVLCTNQVSDTYKPKAKYGNSNIPQDGDFSTFGGRALKFFASLRIFQFKLNTNYKLNKDLQFPSGMTIGFQITKNRLGKPWRTGRLVLLYEGGLNNIFSRLETLIHLKLAERPEEGGIMFRFGTIPTTTFVPKAGERPRNPRIDTLEEWPAFYEEHKSDFELMWAHARRLMFDEAKPEGIDDPSADPDIDEEA